MKQLTEDDFYAKFNLVKNHIDDNASFDGCMFETFGKGLEHVQKMAKENIKKVWTILESNDNLYYSTGYHFVNRLGYLITEEEWTEEQDYKLEKKAFVSTELCPHCGTEQTVTRFVQNCPNCGQQLVACSMCSNKECGNCQDGTNFILAE